MANLILTFAKMPDSVKEIIGKEVSARTEKLAEAKQTVEQNEKEINAIYDKASQERRSLTASEVSEINKLRKEAQKEVAQSLTNNVNEQKKIYQNMLSSMQNLDIKALEERRQNINAQKDEAIQSYKEQQEANKAFLQKGTINTEEYYATEKLLASEHQKEMETLALQYYATMQEKIKRARAAGHDGEVDAYTQQLNRGLKEYGTTIERMEELTKQEENVLKRRNEFIKDNFAEFGHQLSATSQKANEAWESLITDEKTGNIVDNISKVLKEATTTEDGWNNLKFILQHADLTSNAREELVKAMQATEQWDQLSPELKEFATATNAGVTMADILQEKGVWDSLEFEEKKAILHATGIDETTLQFIETHNLWTNTDFVTKLAKIDTTAPDAQQKIHDFAVEFYEAKMQAEAGAVVQLDTTKVISGKSDMDLLNKTIDDMKSKSKDNAIAVDDSSVITAKSSTDSLNDALDRIKNGRSTNISANDYSARSVIRGLMSTLNNLAGSTYTVGIRAITSGFATGTQYAPGGLAYLGDGKRREPFLTPEGHFGVSPATDTLYYLPRGTKVWPSISHFRQDAHNRSDLRAYLGLLPRFATGTPRSFLDTRVANVFKPSKQADTATHITNITEQAPIHMTIDVPVILDNREIARVVTPIVVDESNRLQRLTQYKRGDRF